MKCPGCGGWNADGATLCRACGSSLKVRQRAPRPAQPSGQTYRIQKKGIPYEELVGPDEQGEAAYRPFEATPVNHHAQYSGYMPGEREYSPGIAVLLAILVPGLGHLYMRQIVKGLMFFFLCAISLLLGILGIIVMIVVYAYQIIYAYVDAQRSQRY